MCVPWESNPQPFALLMQCSTAEPQEHFNVPNVPNVPNTLKIILEVLFHGVIQRNTTQVKINCK